MSTIIVQSDWPDTVSDTTSLVERVVPNASRDEAYIRQLVERILWALQDAERAPAGPEVVRISTSPEPEPTSVPSLHPA